VDMPLMQSARHISTVEHGWETTQYERVRGERDSRTFPHPCRCIFAVSIVTMSCRRSPRSGRIISTHY
jgi:hypothetical protein